MPFKVHFDIGSHYINCITCITKGVAMINLFAHTGRATFVSCLIAFFSIYVFTGCDPKASDSDIGDQTMVLVMSNDGTENDSIAAVYPRYMSGITFTTWTIPDSVPTLSQLKEYDVVLLYEDGTFGTYSDSIGGVLHDYVMDGGNLVIGTFYWQESSDGGYEEVGWGKLETIDPIIANDGNAYYYDSTGTWINHPLTRGLDTIYCHYGGGYDSVRHTANDSAHTNATAVAWWKNGDVLMAYNKPNGRIVAVTLWPFEAIDRAGKYDGFYRAWENALLYAAWGDTRNEKSVKVFSKASNTQNQTPRMKRSAYSKGGSH